MCSATVVDEFVTIEGKRLRVRSLPVVSGLERLLDELVEFLFVRVSSRPLLMFVWDQLVLTRFKQLPELCVAFLVCLRVHLLKCTTTEALTSVAVRMGR